MRRPPAVARVLERVTATAREHEMFLPGQLVLVAVSGGPDSMCLLRSLFELRRLFGYELEVFHFDHRLRRGSGEDARYVARAAARLGVRFQLREAEEPPPEGASVEAWARAARLGAAGEVMRETGAARLATGHTLDDQAETVLMALVLGWGPDGLAGIRPVLGAEVRPLLDVPRADVESFCRALRIHPRDDPSNRNTRLLRNAIRLRGLPALERATGREITATIARAAQLLRIDQDELAHQSATAAEDLIEETPEGCRIPAVALLSLPRAIAGRVVRRAMALLGGSWRQADIDGVLDLASGRPGRRRDLTGGSTVRRDREYLSLSRPSPESRV
jgi:tRNA(Ile)-lysidine synthase